RLRSKRLCQPANRLELVSRVLKCHYDCCGYLRRNSTGFSRTERMSVAMNKLGNPVLSSCRPSPCEKVLFVSVRAYTPPFNTTARWCCIDLLNAPDLPDGMRRPVSSGMRYAPNDRRA